MAFSPAVLLGFDGVAVLVYLGSISIHAVATHADLRCELGPFRWVVAGPRFHHWHHSADAGARDRNFATLLPVIDRILGTADLPTGWPTRYGLGPGAGGSEGWWSQPLHPLLPAARR